MPEASPRQQATLRQAAQRAQAAAGQLTSPRQAPPGQRDVSRPQAAAGRQAASRTQAAPRRSAAAVLGRPKVKVARQLIDSEKLGQFLLLGGIATVVLLAFALIAYGYYADRIAPRSQTVLRIGDREFDYDYLERRTRAEIAQGAFDVDDLGNSMTELIANIQREELVRIVAREQDVSVSSDELDSRIRSELGLNPEISRDELASVLRQELIRTHLTLSEYSDQIRALVLSDKLLEKIEGAVPAEGEQVYLRMIQAGSQANALLAKQKLDGGADFAAVAAEHSSDASSAQGGEIGWTPRGVLEPKLEEAAFTTRGRSAVIETELDYYIIEVRDQAVFRIDPASIEEIGKASLNRMVADADKVHPLETLLTESQLTRLTRTLGVRGV
jgi:parvulin-like peptidyl-prolyl isomerase